jgi:hypothetical protein
MTRRKLTASAYIDDRATYVGIILSELAENAAKANSAWMLAADAAKRGDLDRAQTLIIEADIALGPVSLERQDTRRVLQRALDLLEMELPDEPGDT